MVEPVAEMSGTMLQVVNRGRLVSTGGKISNVRINQRPQRAGIESPALRPHCKRRSKHENSPSRILPSRIMRSEKPPVLAAVGRWRRRLRIIMCSAYYKLCGAPHNRYVRSLAAFLEDSMLWPPLLPRILTNQRTVCLCHPVVSMIAER